MNYLNNTFVYKEAQYYRNLAANFESKLAGLAEGQRAAAEAVQQAEALAAAKAKAKPTAGETALQNFGGGLRIYEVALGALFLLLLIRWTIF